MEFDPEEYNQRLEAIFQALTENDLEAAISLSDVLRVDYPERGESYYLLGMMSFALGDHGKALQFMNEGIKLAPDDLEFARALAALNAMTGNLNDVNYFMKLSLVMDSNEFLARVEPQAFADPEHNFERVSLPTQLVNAWVRYHQRRYSDVLQYCETYLGLRPDDDEAYRLKGMALLAMDQPVKALGAFQKAYELAPDEPENGRELIVAYLELGLLKEAREVLATLTSADRAEIDLMQLSVRLAGYEAGAERGSAGTDLERLGETLEKTSVEVPARFVKEVSGHQKLFLGILINEQAMTSSIDFLEAWFQCYDDANVRIVGYQLYERPHVGTSRLKSLTDDWREAFDLDNVTFKHIITNDGIDVLVDLCGVYPGNRQELLASGLKARRVGWLNGAGAVVPATLDAVLHDDFAEPSVALAVDTISLGPGQVAYGGGSVMLEKAGGQNGTGKTPVYGAVMNMPALMRSLPLWCDVLRAVPDAKLMLGRMGDVESELAQHVRTQFTNHGIDGQVEFVDGLEGRTGWVELLSKVDVLLDSVVASETISTCDALWMGVPVVALRSGAGGGFSGASVLSAAGCGDWVADSREDFVAVAAKLVADKSSLQTVRDGLRARVKSSPLCDLRAFAGRMEVALRSAIQR
ncbi:MAG: tetratricopeptide repeat protein [Rhodospirillaceae bacterium]